MPNNQSAIELVSALAERYQISAIRPLLETCRAAADRSKLIIAVLGRFKAGKSSFLNDLIGRDVLPIGVIPVTSVVTEVAYGPIDVAQIRFRDGREVHSPIADLRSYVSEAENSRNEKHVLRVSVQIPELSRWNGLRFVDTPGLESAFAHNTEASLAWAPNVDIALVAIGVDHPLSQQDIELIGKLLAYTPRLAVLLTKVDLFSETEQREVVDFVRVQLARNFKHEIPVYPYSTRTGYDQLRREFEENFIVRVAGDITARQRESVNRKLGTLLRGCEDYLRLTLKWAEMLESERLSSFPRTFACLLDFFDEWLQAMLTSRLTDLSGAKRNEFVQPLADGQRQYQRLLQGFRDRLSERTMALYGVPLRTTEPDIRPASPKMPDVKIGRAFDHNWELLSPILPMFILRNSILRRFRRKIGDEVFKNLSRLTAQWEVIVSSAVFQLQREAERRVEDLIGTVERLTSMAQQQAPQIRQDLVKLKQISEARETRSV
jgi:GTP-binding protein EngB required for normal cell division